MGWYYTHGASKADIVRECLKRTDEVALLAHCVRGNVLWTLNESKALKQRWIGCDLLEKSPDGWGYKPMDETMGLCYYSCPVSYLDKASEPANQWAAEWREEVRARHAKKKLARTWRFAVRLEKGV